MKQIRKGVFETNSSSVHAMCIATEPKKLVIPHEVQLYFDKFGWGEDSISHTQGKLDYALTALFHTYIDDYNAVCDNLYKLYDWLKEDNIRFYSWGVGDAVFGKTIYYDDPIWHNCGSLDHGREAKEFVDYIFENKENMWNFLFSDDSYVMTGNDNDDSIPYINESYPHETFIKGN